MSVFVLAPLTGVGDGGFQMTMLMLQYALCVVHVDIQHLQITFQNIIRNIFFLKIKNMYCVNEIYYFI
jgi:hypothetical protein